MAHDPSAGFVSMRKDIETDIVIVGSGPVGAATAWRLAAVGLSPLIIEKGPVFDAGSLERDRADWELRRARELSSNPNIRRAPFDDPVDDHDTPIKPMFAHGTGGTSFHWSAHVPRFRPEDFRVRSLDGVARDWPISWHDLSPHYELAEERWGTAFFPGDPSGGPKQGRAKPLPTIGGHGRRFARTFDAMGWHWWPVDLVVGREADDIKTRHCTHIGPCDLGCPSRVRSSSNHAFLEDALHLGARLISETRVIKVETDRMGRADALLCRSGVDEFRVRARHFVLAANGSSTPRLLLLSRNARYPNGLANGSGLVGRGLMLHPYAKVDALFDEPLGSWVSGEKAGLISLEFLQTRAERGFKRGVKLQLVTGPPPVALAEGVVTGARLSWGAAHHAGFEARFDRICGFTVCAEDLPEDDNRITLSDTVKDQDGLPVAKWIYRVGDNARKALDFGLDRATDVLKRAGGGEIFRTSLRDQAGFHIMGTARMGDDPAKSVVDANGRCHDVENLWIVDSSVFVTSSALNPTLTAQAFALRAADALAASLRR
ncbi:MAG: GMC family oxidoreductase [Methylobacterium sp.]|nr:GMC family oxidoreductase [Methylobacterium sp.]MCA3602375.1 GMC family oxidoreductase [Methylobacterium sp.]MCA3613907.1 GMC family oxidoreductase [Methylobacterium sp.]MCA3642725.1 GMC family oxidoreductase [Methylobacterium sp.]